MASLDESASRLRGVALRQRLRHEERHLRVALCVTVAALGSATILVTLAQALFGARVSSPPLPTMAIRR